LPSKLAVQRTLGVPYPNWTPEQINGHVAGQAKAISSELRTAGAFLAPEKEMVALIAYLQVLGKSEPVRPAAPTVASSQ
jgi:cytochrome c oxidase cbb3-type subunit I/II